jgi:glutamate transport system ATP-binding protein
MNTASDNSRELLRVDNVGKSYRGERVLSDVSFTQNSGDSTVIIGPSGAGKSTLLRCIAGLESVESGRIYFGDKEIKADRRSRHELKGEIGMLFQSFNLFPHLTVLANVALAPLKVRHRSQREVEELALELLTKVGMANKADSYPEELSGGQSQRVAIARALAMEPKLMLFDEPTSALDPELTKEVLDVMVRLVREGMTVIVVTHEMGFARRASDRVVFMADGRIIEEGPADAVFTRPTHERTSRFLEQILSY